MRSQDRQANAVMIGAILLIGVPAALLGVMTLVTGWLWAADTAGIIHAHPHELIWGWLSTEQDGVPCGAGYAKDCHYTKWGVANWTLLWPLAIFTAYFIYQLCELGWASFRSFHRALTKPARY